MILAVAFAIPTLPLLYLKIVANSIYIASQNRQKDIRAKLMEAVQCLIAVFLSPIVIVLSLIIDVLNLNNSLFRE